MTKPLFSIITVTLNNIDGLKATEQSLKVQTCSDYEWIIIDGNSADGTKEYLNLIRNAQWISEPDNGLYDAMNKGIQRAKGKYCWFMNASDQFYNQDTLKTVSEYVQNHGFIYGDALEDHQYKKARGHNTIISGMFTHHQSMVYKTALLKSTLYDTNHQIAADYDLTHRILKQSPLVNYINQPLCIFETGGLSQQNTKTGRKEQFSIRKKYGVPPIQNLRIYSAQSFAIMIRRTCPWLYWLLKSR